MTDILPAGTQQALLAEINLEQKPLAGRVKKNLFTTVAGAVGYVALTAALPTVGWIALLAYGAAAIGVVGFNRMMRHLGTKATLNQLKRDVKEDGFTAKLAQKVAKVSKNFRQLRNTFDALFLGTSALLLGTFLFATVPVTVVATGFIAAQAAFAAYEWSIGAKYATYGVAGAAGVPTEEDDKKKKPAKRAARTPAPAPENAAPVAPPVAPVFTQAAKETAPAEKPAPEAPKSAAPQP
jgi:hypothetical protein